MASSVKKRSKKSAGPKVDAYALITDRIVEALEAGVVPWQRPWRNSASGGGPASLSTRKPYQGINIWMLAATAHIHGYSSRWWGTYRQIETLGGQVRGGEKGTPVVFWRFIEKTDPTTGKVTDRIPFLRYFTVFNADQAEGLELPEEVALPEIDPIAECERISLGWAAGPAIHHGGNRACYSPMLDRISMPEIGQFKTAALYHATLFHEQVHSTGHESRLERKGVTELGSFGDENYSREELIAEMGAAFLCGEAGIEVNVQHHAAYVASWIRALRADSKLVVQAAGAAQKASDLILGRVKDYDTAEAEKEEATS